MTVVLICPAQTFHKAQKSCGGRKAYHAAVELSMGPPKLPTGLGWQESGRFDTKGKQGNVRKEGLCTTRVLRFATVQACEGPCTTCATME